MKFKCLINDSSKMKELLNMVVSISRHDLRLILILRVESVTLTVPNEQGRPFLWFDINASSFFDVYRLEGFNPEVEDDNVIYFEINTQSLISALGGIKKAANFIEIKLGKSDFPFLTINMKIATDQDKNVSISNLVPVIIIPKIGWEDFNVPYSIPFDVKAKCPRFSLFKRYIDTFKFVKFIKITLRQDKTLTIEAQHEFTRLFSIFQKLDVVDNETTAKYKGLPVAAFVDQKKVAHWLHSITFQPPFKLHCFIEDNQRLKLFIRIRDDIMAQFVIAAEFKEDEDDEVFPASDGEE